MHQINPQTIVTSGILAKADLTKIQQVGVDLTVQSPIFVPHGRAVNVLLNETVFLPKNIYAMLYGRSSFNRKGVLIRGSVYDPGYRGQIGCTIYNMSGENLFIEENERICQMMFFEADPAAEYQGQYQGEYLEPTFKTDREKEIYTKRIEKTFPDNY